MRRTGGLLAELLAGMPLTAARASRVLGRLLEPTTTDAERAGLLVALAGRPLPADALGALASAMRRRATPFPVPSGDRPVDLCGSGGAPVPSFNVSTVSAFVVAAAGVPVVKHGNRSASSLCGSSDLLEALGLPVTTSRAYARATYRSRKIAFLHAPLFHPATKAVAAARKALGIPTVFNRLGPLTNPARVRCHVVGAASLPLARDFAQVLPGRGVASGASVHSEDGRDELSPSAPSDLFLWGNGGPPRRARLRPEETLAPAERRGSWAALPPDRAAAEAKAVLAGRPGARRGAVVLTAGLALWRSGEAPSLSGGADRARAAIDGGAAAELLAGLQELAEPYRLGGRP